MVSNLWTLLIFIQILINVYARNYTENVTCITPEGAYGSCKRVDDCSREKIHLTIEDICYFDRIDPIVCCEISYPASWFARPEGRKNKTRTTPATTTTVTTTIITTSTSTTTTPFPPQNFHSFPKRNSSFGSTTDGNADENPVDYTILKMRNKCYEYGQEISNFEKYTPKMTTIGWKTPDGEIDWKCAGHIISENFVITAAHCTQDKGISPEAVRVCDIDALNNHNDSAADHFNITKIVVHPDYQRGIMYNDIALMEITPKITFSSSIKPSCLWTQMEIPTFEVATVGFEEKTNELFVVNMTVITNRNCRRNLGKNSKLPNGIVGNQICARDLQPNTDSCQSLSGGSLVFKSGSGNYSGEHIIGITSFGESCNKSQPVVFTKVLPYIEWISQTVWPNYTYI